MRRKRKEEIALTEELLRSHFLEIFGDPVTNPKRWEIIELGTQINFVTSGLRGWAKYCSDGGKRFIRSLDVRMNYIADEDVVFVNPPDNAEAKRTRIQGGDVLLTITGSRIGIVASVPQDFEEAYISQHFAIIWLKQRLSPLYLPTYLSFCQWKVVARDRLRNYSMGKPNRD